VHNLDREKKLILISSIPFVVSAFVLIGIGQGLFVSGASKDKEETKNTETIYEKRECRDGKCYDSGKKLIQFKGTNAECEDFKSENERMKCYSENSQSAYACSFLEDKKEVEECYEKRRGNIFEDYQGGGGTLVANKAVASGGARMYFSGFDCRGQHKIQTGTEEAVNSAVTFYDSSRDVHYGGDLSVGGEVTMFSQEAGIYFGSNVSYGEKDLGNGKMGQGLVSYDNFNGMNLNRCMDLKVMANHRHILTITGNNREGVVGGTEVEKGLDVHGDVKANFMFFQGRFLKWSEPIRGHFILYYNTDPVLPTKCGLPDFPRDLTQPKETPPIYEVEGGGGGG
jgi:hypothetical protein